MKFQFQQAVRAIILLAFFAMIFNLHWTGEITKFINPKYENLSKTVAILFLLLFFVQLTRIFSFSTKKQHCHSTEHAYCTQHDHGDSPINKKKVFSYLVIITPLLTGFLMPAKVLDASIADKKGASLILTKQSQTSKIEDYITSNRTVNENIYDEHAQDPMLMEERQEVPKKEYELLKQQLSQNQTIKMTDKDYTIYYEDINKDLSKYLGKKIQLKGFVLNEDSFPQNQLVISRFLITHCIADASIVGFLAEFPKSHTLDDDTWIEVIGTIDITTYNGESLPVIKVDNWVKIEEPEKPYLYPIDILISF
ncbi:TIGR03943 family putative permease subunit [Lysinibacillus sp. NPDC093190]|uniref:TIGR03943 family putative permease subunit n=1 Tax=Lysinibacillus sp. NPDC093190 TaxID=3390575 RepID=UPI003CFF0309